MGDWKVNTGIIEERCTAEVDEQQVHELFAQIATVFQKGNFSRVTVISACAAAIGVAIGAGGFDVDMAMENVNGLARDIAKKTASVTRQEAEQAMAIMKEKAQAYLQQCEKEGKTPTPEEIRAVVQAAMPSGFSIETDEIKLGSKGAVFSPKVGHA